MMVKLLKFDGHWIIAEVDEVGGVEFGDPDCVLKYPCELIGGEVVTFPPHSEDREIAVRSSDITLIAEPDATISALYYDMKAKESE